MNKAKIKRLIFTLGDLEDASFALQMLIDATYGKEEISYRDRRVARCFETAFLASFGRAFRIEKSQKSPLYDVGDLGLSIDDSARELRTLLLGLRDKVFAHSDTDYTNVALYIREDVANGVNIVYPEYFRGVYLSDEQQALSMRLLSTYKNGLLNKLLSLSKEHIGLFREIQAEILNTKDLFQLLNCNEN
jgi:hypothetical protein